MWFRFYEWFNENLDFILKWLPEAISATLILIFLVFIQMFFVNKLEAKKI